MLSYSKNRLQRWLNNNTVHDEMLWKGPAGHQFTFVRDILVYLVGVGLHHEEKQLIPSVISTHRSKSITLPVYKLERKDLGLVLILRDNFYNWKLSVISEKAVEADFSGLFQTSPPVDPEYTGDSLHEVYFEGFPKELIFGYYDSGDKKKWSAEIHGDHTLYTVVFLIMRTLGAVKPLQSHTQESHRKKLDEDSEWSRTNENQEKVEVMMWSDPSGDPNTALKRWEEMTYTERNKRIKEYEDYLLKQGTY